MLLVPPWVHGYAPGEGAGPILDWLAAAGIRISYARGLPAGQLGAYDHEARVIWLPAALDLATPLGVAVLAHESVHAYRGDAGHQVRALEDRIDETVAAALVDPGAYARAEDELGWATGGIADVLDQPRWLVSAYRRHLRHVGQHVGQARTIPL